MELPLDRYTGPISSVVEELREELIFEPYGTVDWSAARDFIAPDDLYTPHTRILDLSFALFNIYEKVAPTAVRKVRVIAVTGATIAHSTILPLSPM